MAKGHSFAIGFEVRNGKFVIDAGAISRAVKSWPDCQGVLTLDQDEAHRSSAANRYLWAIYKEITHETGQSKDDIHDEMCARFTTEMIRRVDPKTGRMVEFEVVRGTSGMKVSQFHAFVENVKLFSAEFFGLTFEDPPEDYRKEAERAKARDAKKGQAA